MKLEEMKLPEGTFIVGNKLMAVCAGCGKIVRIDKPIFGGYHFCAIEKSEFVNLGKDKTGTMEQGMVIKR